MSRFTEYLDKLYVASGLSERAFAKLIGINHNTYRKWRERGTEPRIDVVEDLVHRLGGTIEYGPHDDRDFEEMAFILHDKVISIPDEKVGVIEDSFFVRPEGWHYKVSGIRGFRREDDLRDFPE
ncbi:MAG: helix-turn-helix transcriptional regulator [Epibacterium sp.]|nr:helix-turn-helix transcriptional regulator [Epibacterium sp.]NQX73790.1 helix-turn-helix transcriptional regulator [Epibacterium sp.]